MNNNLLELNGISKRFKSFSLKDASFSLPRGTIMGLIGPNGAGKTTLVKAILGLVGPDSGEIHFKGRDLISEGAVLRQHIAYVPDKPKYTKGARLQTLKDIYAGFFPSWNESRWKNLMKDFDLDPKKKSKTLSLGQRTRFALTLAMSHDAELLILDEPTTGLDPVFRRELIQRLISILNERHSILFSTHITSDLEERADLVTLIRDGEVFFSQSRDKIRETWFIVKGTTDLLDSNGSVPFAGLRKNSRGFEGLTNDPESARICFNGQATVEQATLEDILVLMGRKKANV
jgi:ABC-2 type transport system ATP-binding protein